VSPHVPFTVPTDATRRVELATMVLACVRDAVARLLYHDRKEDSELPVGAVEALLDAGVLRLEELVTVFGDELRDATRYYQ
jgi:hypothetical protein